MHPVPPLPGHPPAAFAPFRSRPRPPTPTRSAHGSSGAPRRPGPSSPGHRPRCGQTPTPTACAAAGGRGQAVHRALIGRKNILARATAPVAGPRRPCRLHHKAARTHERAHVNCHKQGQPAHRLRCLSRRVPLSLDAGKANHMKAFIKYKHEFTSMASTFFRHQKRALQPKKSSFLRIPFAPQMRTLALKGSGTTVLSAVHRHASSTVQKPVVSMMAQ